MAEPLFKSKIVKIDTLGAYLKQIREKLNLDIKTVGLLTQIKPVYLENLEAGNYDKLPADVYVRGFLKNLSMLYRIEENVLIEQFEKEHGLAQVFERRKPKITKGAWFTPKTIIIAATSLVFLGAFAYVGSQVSSVLTPPTLTITEPAADGTVTGNSIVVAGKAEIGADVSINDQAVYLDQNGEFNENVILSGGLNVIEIVAKNKFNKVSKIDRTINANIPTATPATAAALPVNITVNIGPGPAWVSVEADGVVVQRGTMLGGSSKTISAKSDIVLTTANAGSTDVIYNGKDLGKLGRDEEVIRNVDFSSSSSP